MISIKENVSLADKNWFKTGGSARFFCEPIDHHEFTQALGWAREHQQPLFVLGEGANILISDEGFKGLVIRPALKDISITYSDHEIGHVYAGAGVRFGDLIQFCLANNLGGLEEFSGIPGTVGGSVFINIHYFEFLLSNFIVAAQVIDRMTGHVQTVDTAWFEFGYNYSKLHEQQHYLISATFKLKKVTDLEAAFAQGRSIEMIRYRGNRYPKSHTCGSFFRNFYPHEVVQESNGKKLIFVGYYLDKVGVKGDLCVGDAIVSWQHANMIVNRGSATSQDIINLAQSMQSLVEKSFGIKPQPECQLIGFEKNSLE